VSEPLQTVSRSGLIDLHTHTNESDGTLSPEALVKLAGSERLSALAITDHDTFAGYEKARIPAREAGLDLVCGIELNTRLEIAGSRVRYAHVLGYFPNGDPTEAFQVWLAGQQADRRDRNRRLSLALATKGVHVSLAEVEARGKSLAGRPHFARVLVEKGYAKDADDAFRRYIGENAPTFVERQSMTSEEVIRVILDGGGIPAVAHPVRLFLPRGEIERKVFMHLKESGLLGIEVYHSEQPAALQSYYMQLAQELDLLPVGGSDFHGTAKPDISLGSGRDGNVRVPVEFLQRLRASRNGSSPLRNC
jgi:predicted metal-dependent phosphoesterase TrpH